MKRPIHLLLLFFFSFLWVHAFTQISHGQEDASHDILKSKNVYNRFEDSWEKTKTRKAFGLKVVFGTTFAHAFKPNQFFSSPNRLSPQRNISPHLGLALTYQLLPTKWSIFFSPIFQNHYSSYISGQNRGLNVYYNTLEVHLGLRYYPYVNPYIKSFVNISYVVDTRLAGAGFSTPNSFGFYSETSSISTLDIGLGVNILDKCSLEFRIHGPRNIHRDIYTNRHPVSSSLIIGLFVF